jgi:two-component system chemotaxis sensor kinase CheA
MFVFEAEQLLEQLESIVLAAEVSEQGFSRKNIDEIFRIMHTIKGSAAMMQFTDIAQVTHTLEDVFSILKEKQNQALHKPVVELVIATLDYTRGEIEKLKDGKQVDGSSKALVARVRDIQAQLTGESVEQPSATMRPESAGKKGFAISLSEQGLQQYRAKARFDPGAEMENIRAFGLVHKLTDYVDTITHEPAELSHEQAAEEIRNSGLTIWFSTDQPLADIRQIFEETLFLEEFEISDVIAEETTAIEATLESAAGSLAAESEVEERKSVSRKGLTAISTDKLDLLVDLVGELVISESMVTQNPDLKGLVLEGFQKASAHHRKIIDDLQDLAMSLRMVPIGNVFQRMQRVLRDACQQSGKEAVLELFGEETEIDKSIVETLSDPLLHLVRNAVDHGLEDPETRKSRGKSPTGRVVLEAKNAGGDIVITITDDGHGINTDRILEKARRTGLVAQDAAELSTQEIYQLLFAPGFSTRDGATALSGRGVGLDVVKSNLERIRGSVMVDSRVGIGTQFSLRIPLTLAIISGMLISVGRSCYTIPITDIVECFRPEKSMIVKDLDNREMVMVRGNAVPVQRLHQLYDVRTEVTELEKGILIMVEKNNTLSCVFADQLLGEQQVVVKALPDYIRKVKGIAGCTLLGDGGISLILDIDGLREFGGLERERRW